MMRSVKALRPVAGAILAVALLTASADAQPTRATGGVGDSVPRALLLAVLQSGADAFAGSDNPTITVGSLPASIASDLYVPPGATVIGAIAGNSAAYAFLRVFTRTDSLQAQFERELKSRGWMPPPTPEMSGGGFRSTPVPRNTPVGSLVLCRGLEMLTVGILPPSYAAANVTLRLESANRGYACNAPRATFRGMPPGFTVPPLPVLINPPSAPFGPANAACNSGASNVASTPAMITPLTAQSLLTHYETQLSDSGWVPVPRSNVVGHTWMRTDSAGVQLQTTIMVIPRGDSAQCLEPRLEVRTHRTP